MTSTARHQLLNLLAENSFGVGDFTLSYGIKSDYYIDCRTTTLHARGAELIGRVFLELFRQQGWQAQAVGGMTMGADPIVVAAAVISAQAGTPVHGFLVRKQEKTHGMGRRIEGFQERGAPVVIVDDVCTTGGSTNHANEAARAARVNIVRVALHGGGGEAGGPAGVGKRATPPPLVA